MAKQQNFFIGFATLEGLAESLDAPRPVYVAGLSGGQDASRAVVETRRAYVLAAQVGGNEVLYCRIPVGVARYFEGNPYDDAAQDQHEVTAGAVALVKTWLTERGFTVREAAVALPTTATLLDGAAGFLRFDEPTRRYIRKE